MSLETAKAILLAIACEQMQAIGRKCFYTYNASYETGDFITIPFVCKSEYHNDYSTIIIQALHNYAMLFPLHYNELRAINYAFTIRLIDGNVPFQV